MTMGSAIGFAVMKYKEKVQRYDFVGGKIKNSREQAGLTQQQLAEYIREPVELVAAYETAAREPGIGSLSRIARVLGLNLEYLLYDPISYPSYIDINTVLETNKSFFESHRFDQKAKNHVFENIMRIYLDNRKELLISEKEKQNT